MDIRERLAKLEYEHSSDYEYPWNYVKTHQPSLMTQWYLVADSILALGLVELNEDQGLPENPYTPRGLDHQMLPYSRGQDDMVKAGWRKIKES